MSTSHWHSTKLDFDHAMSAIPNIDIMLHGNKSPMYVCMWRCENGVVVGDGSATFHVQPCKAEESNSFFGDLEGALNGWYPRKASGWVGGWGWLARAVWPVKPNALMLGPGLHRVGHPARVAGLYFPPMKWRKKDHFTHEPRAVTMELWEPKRKCPKGRLKLPPKSCRVVTDRQV